MSVCLCVSVPLGLFVCVCASLSRPPPARCSSAATGGAEGLRQGPHTHTDAQSLQALEAAESYTGGLFFFVASATSCRGPVSRRGSGEVPIQSQECRGLRLRAAWRILQLSRGGSGRAVTRASPRSEAPGLPPGHQERPGARAEEPARPGEPSYVPCITLPCRFGAHREREGRGPGHRQSKGTTEGHSEDGTLASNQPVLCVLHVDWCELRRRRS